MYLTLKQLNKLSARLKAGDDLAFKQVVILLFDQVIEKQAHEIQMGKLIREIQFWRAKFVGTSLHSFIRSRPPANWYDNPPPIQIADKVLVCGPICTTAEHAETLARERKAQKDRRFFASHGKPWGWDFVEVVKVGQNGYPL